MQEIYQDKYDWKHIIPKLMGQSSKRKIESNKYLHQKRKISNKEPNTAPQVTTKIRTNSTQNYQKKGKNKDQSRNT